VSGQKALYKLVKPGLGNTLLVRFQEVKNSEQRELLGIGQGWTSDKHLTILAATATASW
jgi:hypothetical protein